MTFSQSMVLSGTDWIRTRLPGWFSKYAPDRFPCCEFLTTEVGEVFPTEAKSSQYLRLLGLHTSWFGYRSEHWPGLTLCTEHQDDSRWTWVLCGRTGEIFTDSELAGWGKRDNRGFANRLRYLADTLARQALYAHLVERALRLGTLRDELGKLSIDDHAGAVDRLAAVQKDVILHSRDVAVVVADARLLTSHNHLFFHEVGEFEPLDRRVGEPGLMESVRKNLVELSGRLETLFAALQPMVEMSAAFMNTRAADRLARSNNRMSVWMTWMAVAMLLATIVQIALALTRWAE